MERAAEVSYTSAVERDRAAAAEWDAAFVAEIERLLRERAFDMAPADARRSFSAAVEEDARRELAAVQNELARQLKVVRLATAKAGLAMSEPKAVLGASKLAEYVASLRGTCRRAGV